MAASSSTLKITSPGLPYVMLHYLTPDDLPKTSWHPPVSWFVSRVCWREIGRRLHHHPELIEQSRRHLDGVLRSGDYSCSPRYIQQWQDLLSRGIQPVIQVLMSPDDDVSQVLRSCTPRPIRGLLSPEERDILRDGVVREMKELGLHE